MPELDFIDVCIKQLAANAKDTVAMTDDEKKRLKELLTDIESLPDIPEEGLDTQASILSTGLFQ